MARKKLVAEKTQAQVEPLATESLDEIIDSYGQIKDQIASLDKLAKAQNADIKAHIKEVTEEDDGKYSYSGNKYVATLTMRDSSKMNEEKLIAFLKKNKLAKNIVKKKEYIDEKAFEEAVYNGTISEEQLLEMDSCKDVSVTEVLTIKKIKGA